MGQGADHLFESPTRGEFAVTKLFPFGITNAPCLFRIIEQTRRMRACCEVSNFLSNWRAFQTPDTHQRCFAGSVEGCRWGTRFLLAGMFLSVVLSGCRSTPSQTTSVVRQKELPQPEGQKPVESAASRGATKTDSVEKPTWVIVRGCSTLVHPFDKNQTYRNPVCRPDSSIEDRESIGARFRLVRDLGENLEVETPEYSSVSEHCRLPFGFTAGLGIRFLVAKKDIMPVISKPFAIDYSDGTSLRFFAGVPLSQPLRGELRGESGSNSIRRVYTESFEMQIAIPDSYVSTSYDQPAPGGSKMSDLMVADGAQILFGSTSVELNSGARFDDWGTIVPSRRVRNRISRGGKSLVEISGVCGDYTGIVGVTAVVDSQDDFGKDIVYEHQFAAEYEVKKGAIVYDTAGREWGKVWRETMLAGEGDVINGKRCFERQMSSREERCEVCFYRVCFDAQDLIVPQPLRGEFDPSRINATTRYYVRVELNTNDPRPNRSKQLLAKSIRRQSLWNGSSLAFAPDGESIVESRQKAINAGVKLAKLVVSIQFDSSRAATKCSLFDESSGKSKLVRDAEGRSAGSDPTNVELAKSMDRTILFVGQP